MSTTDHERARDLAAASRVEGLAAGDRRWLEAHLRECVACQRREQGLDEGLRELRLADVRVEPWLRERTGRRLRDRARALAEPDGHWALVASVALACVSALPAGTGLWLSLRGMPWGVSLAARLALAVALWFWPASVLAAAATVLGPRLRRPRATHLMEVRS